MYIHTHHPPTRTTRDPFNTLLFHQCKSHTTENTTQRDTLMACTVQSWPSIMNNNITVYATTDLLTVNKITCRMYRRARQTQSCMHQNLLLVNVNVHSTNMLCTRYSSSASDNVHTAGREQYSHYSSIWASRETTLN